MQAKATQHVRGQLLLTAVVADASVCAALVAATVD